MCRIAGFWDFNYKGNYDFENTIVSMRDVLAYGGPDDCGVYADKEQGIALGHRRLSIIDLSERGHQPMPNCDKSLWIAYNGEVYNFPEIRKELEAKSYHFISNSDTEVILKAYEEWGMGSVHKFRGMFAFALWDRKKEKLIICRDRAGVKPLYYYHKDGLFMFASELKSFHKHCKFLKQLEEKSLGLYLQFGYIGAPHTIFKHAYKLKPGYYLEINKRGDVKETKYWDIQEYYQKGLILQKQGFFEHKNQDDIALELENILLESFKLRLVSDVPLGIFLSGGLDSSLVTALIQKDAAMPVKTFTIGFKEEKYNEAGWAREVAKHLGTEHTEVYCTYNDALNKITKLPEIYDEPLADSSTIPSILLSNLAKQHVKVCLSGDGGDEFFCGYSKYWIIKEKMLPLARFPFMPETINLISPDLIFNLYRVFEGVVPKCPNLKDRYKKIRSILNTQDPVSQSLLYSSVFTESDLKLMGFDHHAKFFEVAKEFDPVTAMMLYDSKTYLPDDILTKVDRASMSIALEAREPMLDHHILEYTAKLPLQYKYHNKTSKYILRKILYKYVPEKLVRRPKKGFGMPVYEWFKTDLINYYKKYLNKDRVENDGFLNASVVDNMLKQCLSRQGASHSKLWLLLNFQMWKEKWM
ncbi:MAG: asparagine synthase (glutamine-hydrolyzing) [Candidatus Omnitrophica bacterium]|nr:asparagine synthase (glutamine-hydrolyzing) [Candidatus Omnitrophota bacterium]